MGQDEVGTLSAVQAVQLEIIEPALYAMKPDYLAHNLKKKTCK